MILQGAVMVYSHVMAECVYVSGESASASSVVRILPTPRARSSTGRAGDGSQPTWTDEKCQRHKKWQVLPLQLDPTGLPRTRAPF